MASEIKDATEADLDAIKADLLYEWRKSYPIEHIAGWAKSLFIDGNLVAIGGVYVLREGLGQAWIVLGSKAENHKIEIVRVIRRMIDMAFEELGIWRLEATERVDFVQTNKMAHHLGFHNETPFGMKAYCEDKSDAYLYAIIRNVI